MKHYEEVRSTQSNLSRLSKQFLCTIVFLTTFNYLNAQDSYSKKLSMGIEIGPNLTTFYGESNHYYQTLPAIGFSGGLTFQVVINKLISLRTSYLFQLKVEKPKKSEHPIDGILKSSGSYHEHSNFYYLGIPILLQFNFGKKVGFFVNTGPNLSFLLKGEKITKTNDNPTKKSTLTTSKFDFGLTAGVGLVIPIKERFSLTFEARNNLCFKPPYNYQESKFYSIDFLVAFSIFNH